jgi:predicted nucleic acid-binding protein
MREMARRPVWQAEEPFETDPVTFEQAKREMTDIQRRQGRSVSAAPWIAARNFLLRGVPVVTNDLQD